MPERPAKHQPQRLSGYLQVHETVMGQFRSNHFIGEDSLTVRPFAGLLLMFGEIACAGGIIIQVKKGLEKVRGSDDDDPMIQTVRYDYNVSRHGHGNIFRYDDIDHHVGKGNHKDEHHKHLFDDTGEELMGSPIWVGAMGWPVLGEVIEEARQWYYENRQRLLLSDEYPPIRSWP